ncbi:MAG: TlpA family protein disulfide reductase [Myxococcales bacterium]
MRRTAALLVLALGAFGCAKVESLSEPLPEFEVQNLDGATVSPATLRGKPTLINFWSPQ